MMDMPALKLYYAPGACSFVPHCLLQASGAVFEPVMVKLHKGEQREAPFLALNPRGQVPVLSVDGQVVTQILAIIDRLDRLFPQQRFLPIEDAERSRVMELLAWMNNTVHPTFTHVFMPEKFASDAQARTHLTTHNRELFRSMLLELEQRVVSSYALGHDLLSGNVFGPADAYAVTLLRWGGIAGIDPTAFQVLWPHVLRVAALPAVATVIARERLQLNLFRPPAAGG
jgi:glutathione S-transferase